MGDVPERWLDRLVREHRVTIAVVFPLVGAVTLVASAASLLPGVLAFNPYLLLFGTLVMRLPLVAALAPLVTRRTLGWLGLLVAYTYAIEWVGVTTGWPYGEFAYAIELGPMVGGIPVGLPVFFVPLVVNAYLLAVLLTRGRRGALPLALGLVLAITPFFAGALFPGANIFLILLVGTGLALFNGLTYSMLAGAMPRSGGEYVYNGRVLHPAIGFMANWGFTWS
jgi:putative membrane protein